MVVRMMVWITGLLVMFMAASTAFAQEGEPAEMLRQAYQAIQPFPVLSVSQPNLDVPRAYAIQKAYVEHLLAHDAIAGFKAGLTSAAGQQKFGVTEPVAGVLLASGRLADGAEVDRAGFAAVMIETEIGYVIGQPISQPIADVAELRAAVRGVLPVIELPDLGFTDMANLKGVDIIAANVSARQMIVGQERPLGDLDVNAVTVTLTLDGQVVNQGQGTDALGDQWQAALWLVNTMLAQGWTLEPGAVVITGALGQMLPGKSGRYLADYGDFGALTFTIK